MQLINLQSFDSIIASAVGNLGSFDQSRGILYWACQMDVGDKTKYENVLSLCSVIFTEFTIDVWNVV